MKEIIFSLFLLINFFAFGQRPKAIITAIKEVNSVSKKEYIFPYVTIPNNKTASKKINNALLEFLQLEEGKFKKSIFENVSPPKSENVDWLYYDLNFKVVENNSKILAIYVWAANAYDDLGNFNFEFTLQALKPYLSTYAKRLFFD